MENMSEAMNETVKEGDYNSLELSDINDDIIDVSALDFSDHDTWLQPPSQDIAENSIHDLNFWLRNNIEQDCNNLHDNRRSIDTRTFTRPKKRSGRLNFESIIEATSPQSQNVWNQVSSNTKQADRHNAEFTSHDSDSIPHMLRPSISGVSNLCSASSALTSGQESLEAFLNMSRSKGIDSFIDLAEPEFSDDIMDVSQPSVLYSSVMSVPNDDLSQTIRHSLNQTHISRHSGIEDSQILTESMMQTSMFGDVVDVNFNDTFAKNSANVTVLENTNYCSSMDTTFLAASATKAKDTFNGTSATFNRGNFQSMDATYTPSQLDTTLTNDPHASYIVNRCMSEISDAKPSTINNVDDTNFVMRTEIAKDASFIIRSVTPDMPENTTFKLDTPNIGEQNNTFNVQNADVIFEKTPLSSPRKSSISMTSRASITKNEHPINEISNASNSDKVAAKVNQQNVHPVSIGETLDNLDTTFCKPAPKMHSKLIVAPSLLPKPSDTPYTGEQNDTFNVRNFDATFEKTPALSPRRASLNLTLKMTSMIKDHPINETFKAPTCQKDITNVAEKNIDPLSRGGSLDNLDTTCCKPAAKMHSQLNPPRPLSRLPQSFQKSNPNLVSNSLKYGSTMARTGIPSFGFNRAARPSTARNVEGLQLTSKLSTLGKMKSGSEQRLDVTRNISELQIPVSGGSTESIDSTQSAHSAPDFDDRLSVRSDSSNTSYSMRTMNIEEFQKIVRMREECLKQESTPKPSRRVLENNWVAASNDLPSPILKNGPETYGSRGSSPRSTDSTVKTSSPLLSPTGSLQNLTIDAIESNKDNTERRKLAIPRTKSVVPNNIPQVSVKPPRNTGEHRTGLRPPASWTSTNRPASGIPRPASRIPAPRFARPNTKINQGDTKK